MNGGRVRARRVLPVNRDAAGRVLILPFADVSNGDPWARLEPLVDILRKLPEGTTGAPAALVEQVSVPPAVVRPPATIGLGSAACRCSASRDAARRCPPTRGSRRRRRSSAT